MGAKLFGKQTTIVIHQIVTDLRVLSGHIGIATHTRKITLFTGLLQIYYQLLSAAADTIIVLEESLKQQLCEFVDEKKIVVIPHGVSSFSTRNSVLQPPSSMLSQRAARNVLGIPHGDIVLLYFGYITWYKGADMLVQGLKGVKTIQGKPVRLLLAGGMTPTQKEKKHYREFFHNTLNRAKKKKHISITGFIPEENIPLYYQAADIIMLPYRTYMSSSGPLALSLAYHKPFLLSHALQKIMTANDVQDACTASGLHQRDIIFSLNSNSLQKVISSSLEKSTSHKLQQFVQLLAGKRSYDVLASRYDAVLFRHQESTIFVTPAIR